MARGLSDMIFGKKDPAANNAKKMLESADYHGEVIRAAIAGEPAPAFPGGSMSASGLKGMFSGFGLKKFLFGQEKLDWAVTIIHIGLDPSYGRNHSTSGRHGFLANLFFQRLFMSSDRFGDSFFKNYLAETLVVCLVHSLDLQKAVSWDIQAVV